MCEMTVLVPIAGVSGVITGLFLTCCIHKAVTHRTHSVGGAPQEPLPATPEYVVEVDGPGSSELALGIAQKSPPVCVMNP